MNKLEGGLRLKGVKKKSLPGKPLVTIITATFNASENFPKTIKSIRELNYKNIEWILVDGASKDETVRLIRHNEDVIDYWVSEPDSGIYDAWNKGITLARGDWIAFLGAGDSYCQDAINIYMGAISSASIIPEFVSSRVRLVNSTGVAMRVWGAPFKWELFNRYMTVAHAGALHHRSLFEKHGVFDTSYSSAADYEFLMRCGARLGAVFLDEILVDMLVGGISNSNKGLFETYLIQRRYGVNYLSAKLRLWVACTKAHIRPFVRGY